MVQSQRTAREGHDSSHLPAGRRSGESPPDSAEEAASIPPTIRALTHLSLDRGGSVDTGRDTPQRALAIGAKEVDAGCIRGRGH